MTLYEVLEEVRSADRGILIITKEREDGLCMTYAQKSQMEELWDLINDEAKGNELLLSAVLDFVGLKEDEAYKKGYIDGGISQITEGTP